MNSLKGIIAALAVSCTLYTVFGAIAHNRKENAIVRQDDEDGPQTEGEETEPVNGEEEATTPDPETLTSVDRFVYGFNALVKAFEVFFSKIDRKVESKVMTLEDFLNLIHDKVHLNGTDYHETAYITERVKK